MKSIKKLLGVTVVAILLCSMVVATVSATTDVKDDEKNTGVTIEPKEKKVSSYKVTWNYNGGKIGSKKSKVTTVKRGSKIGKLVATPQRSRYTFKGWYTKKSGGKKISKSTKVTKKVTFFAQWTKKTSSSSSTDAKSKLLGVWHWEENYVFPTYSYAVFTMKFNADGTFSYASNSIYVGNYKESNGKITFTKVTKKNDGTVYSDLVVDYRFKKNSQGTREYLQMPYIYFPGNYKYRTYGEGSKMWYR